MLDKGCDPDFNFYNANVQKLDTPYISSQDFPSLRKTSEQDRNYSKGGGVSIYINKSLSFKLRADLSINSRDAESLSMAIFFISNETL